MEKQNIQPPPEEENKETKLPEGDHSTAAESKKADPPKPTSPEEKGNDETIGIP